MNRNIRIIHNKPFMDAIHQMNCGERPFASIDAKDFEIEAWDIKPIEGYEVPTNETTQEKLPYCCDSHKKLFDNVSKWFESFPNCCDAHRKLNGANWFIKDRYKYIAEKVINQTSYTEHHIVKQIDAIDWYKDITDYIEANYSSFGQLPAGYGNAVGLNFYLGRIESAIRGIDLPEVKREKLLKFVLAYYGEKKESEIDLNALYSTYRKWLNVFPFKISYLSHLKPFFEKQIPILDGKPELNKYAQASKIKIQTHSGLVFSLIQTTHQLLTQINGLALYEKGKLTNAKKIQIELINENRRLKLIKMGEKPCEEKLKYISIINEWLKDEKAYFKELTPLLEAEVKDAPIKENAGAGKKFYSDQDFEVLVKEILSMDLIRIEEFLEYHFSNSFGDTSMNQSNWLAMLRKHLFWLRNEIAILKNEDYNLRLSIADKWQETKITTIVKEVNDSTNKTSKQAPQLKTLAELKGLENKFWKGIPIEVVISHFKVMTERVSKNGDAFLSEEQLRSFIQRAFLKDEKQPKQKINFANGEKGFVIKRFYEFFDLSVSKYNELTRKEKYINLVLNNFENLGEPKSVKLYFKPNKTREMW